MFLVERRDARRIRKYQFGMVVIFVLLGSLGPLLTMHIAVLPKDMDKRGQPESRSKSSRILWKGVAIFFAVLVALLLFATKNDVLRLLGLR
jgi:hypothetical protein